MLWQRFFPAAVLSLLLATSSSWAALIPLDTPWTPAPNKAPPYYIWQNDPGLTEYLNSAGVTGLCVPSAISNAVLYQYGFKAKRSTQLKIWGLQIDPSTGKEVVDSNSLIRYFAKACGYTTAKGTALEDAAACIADFYADSGYTNASVRLIRNIKGKPDSRYQVEDRAPTIEDIQDGLNQGYEVLVSVIMMKQNSLDRWVKVGSHSFNVYGITNEGLVVSNPTRAYRVNNVDPVFDIVPYQYNNVHPEDYSNIEIFGRTLERPNAHTFIAGITLIKPE